jgi:predicted transcriptional regulator
MALAELCAKWRRTRHCLEQAIKRYEERERSIAVREGLRRADPLARSVRAENAARVNAHAAYGRAL